MKLRWNFPGLALTPSPRISTSPHRGDLRARLSRQAAVQQLLFLPTLKSFRLSPPSSRPDANACMLRSPSIDSSSCIHVPQSHYRQVRLSQPSERRSFLKPRFPGTSIAKALNECTDLFSSDDTMLSGRGLDPHKIVPKGLDGVRGNPGASRVA